MEKLYFWSSRIAWGALVGNILSVFALYGVAYYWNFNALPPAPEGCVTLVQLPVHALFESLQIVGVICGVVAIGAFFVWLFALVFTRVSKNQQNLYLGLLLLAPFMMVFILPLRMVFMIPFLLLVSGDPCFDIN